MSQRLVHDGPLIIGGGLAGLSAALEAAPRKVLVVTPARLLEACSSAWAQGGMAAALTEADAPDLHARDTIAAGAGLVDPVAARDLTDHGRETVEWLAGLGAPFDRDESGRFEVGLEAAHSRARVARVGGDGAGRAILSALVAAVRGSRHITVWEDGRLRGLVRDAEGRIRGALIERQDRLVEILAPSVILATGGYGGLFARTTTPASLLGEGMAAAWLAGAEIRDPEFFQFHPTAIDIGMDPMPLATEALRGEGARLVDGAGRYLLGAEPDADLAPRDIVARAVHAAVASGAGAFLDAREAVGAAFPEEFPSVFAACMRAAIDPRLQPIPIAPAAHYAMGGIRADTSGRTSLEHLRAIGECASTGVHGANRLASNSLLEAAAFGRRAGRDAAEGEPAPKSRLEPVEPAVDLPAEALTRLRRTMSADVGVVRDEAGLTRALAAIEEMDARTPGVLALTAARLVTSAALARRESRGGHFRLDFPQALPVATHTLTTGPARTPSARPEMASADE